MNNSSTKSASFHKFIDKQVQYILDQVVSSIDKRRKNDSHNACSANNAIKILPTSSHTSLISTPNVCVSCLDKGIVDYHSAHILLYKKANYSMKIMHLFYAF